MEGRAGMEGRGEWKEGGNGRKGGNGRVAGEAGMEYSFLFRDCFFTLRRLRGGCEREAVAGGGVFPMMFGNFATPQKFAGANFYPPPQAAEVERKGAGGEKYFHSCEGRNLCGDSRIRRQAT